MKKIIIVFILIVLVSFTCVFYTVSKNNKYTSSIEKKVKEKYSLQEDIKYLNKSNFYYIIETNTLLILLDDNYNEVQKINTSELYSLDKPYEIVYRLNKIMYEKREVLSTKIIYTYYDIYTGEVIETVNVGG